jgi:hypothetical protein
MTSSREVEALHIENEDSPNSLKQIWPSHVEQPARAAKQAISQLTVLKWPFRFLVQPIIDHVLEIERKNRIAPSRFCCQSSSNANGINILFTTSALKLSRCAC